MKRPHGKYFRLCKLRGESGLRLLCWDWGSDATREIPVPTTPLGCQVREQLAVLQSHFTLGTEMRISRDSYVS